MSGGGARRALPAIPSTHTSDMSVDEITIDDRDHVVDGQSQIEFEQWMKYDKNLRRHHWYNSMRLVNRSTTSRNGTDHYLYLYFLPPTQGGASNMILDLYQQYHLNMDGMSRPPPEAKVTRNVQALFLAQGHYNFCKEINDQGFGRLGNEFMHRLHDDTILSNVWVNEMTEDPLVKCIVQFENPEFDTTLFSDQIKEASRRTFNVTMLKLLEDTGYCCSNESMSLALQKNQECPEIRQTIMRDALKKMITYRVEDARIVRQNNSIPGNLLSQEESDEQELREAQQQHNAQVHYGGEPQL